MNLLGALIGGRVGRELPRVKFRGKIFVIRSPSHYRTWGTRRRMEHLMRRYELQSARNGYRVWEVTFSHGKKKDACGANHSRSKPHFSHQIKGKNWSFEELLWDTEI